MGGSRQTQRFPIKALYFVIAGGRKLPHFAQNYHRQRAILLPMIAARYQMENASVPAGQLDISDIE